MTPTGRRKKPSIPIVFEWVKSSWDTVKTKIVVKAFKKCGISKSLDGNKDDILFEESDGSGGNEPSELDFSDSECNNTQDFEGFYNVWMFLKGLGEVYYK